MPRQPVGKSRDSVRIWPINPVKAAIRKTTRGRQPVKTAIRNNSNSISRRYLCWLVFGSSTYCRVRLVASFLAAWISSLIWNRNKKPERERTAGKPLFSNAPNEKPTSLIGGLLLSLLLCMPFQGLFRIFLPPDLYNKIPIKPAWWSIDIFFPSFCADFIPCSWLNFSIIKMKIQSV